MKLFLDTNILIDFLADRGAFTEQSRSLFSLSIKESDPIALCASSHAFATTYYILSKVESPDVLKKTLLALTELVEVLGVSRESVLKSLTDSSFPDFEDGIQFHTADGDKTIDYIITRNLRDFRNSTIPVLTTDEFLLKFSI